MPFGNRSKRTGRPQHPLSSIREKENLGQDELSVIIGASVQTISRVENGLIPLPFKNLYALSEAFDIGFEEYIKEVRDFQYKMRDYLSAL